jgi:outer membrane protein TolC
MGRQTRLLLKLLALLMALPGLGCTRHFFRKRADKDVEQLLTEKNVFEPWQIENWHVYPDPRSRFADPSDPDHPPLPPDDPAAQYLSPNPQKPHPRDNIGRIEGTGYLDVIAAWDAMNRANRPPELPPVEAATPTMSPTPPDPCPPPKSYLINLQQSCELGLFNSRDYQDQRENLYLTALPVSLQRYGFAAQFFALGNAGFQSGADGSLAPGQRWFGGGSAGFNKLFPTGATLLAQFANQFVVNLGAAGPQASVTTMTMNLTQPLLRGGGKAVNLEPLTQAERNLLYQIRTYARFRKQFYVNVAAGPSAATSFTVFDPTLGALTTQASTIVGYLPTVQRAATLEADRENVRNFQRFVRLLDAYAEGGIVAPLQVDQTRQQLLQGQVTVLNDELGLRNNLDRFKIQLGVPPTVGLELDDAPIRPMIEQLARFQAIIDQYRELVDMIDAKFSAAEDAAKLRERLKGTATDSALVRDTTFRTRILPALAEWEKLTDDQLAKRLATLREDLRKFLAERDRSVGKDQPAPPGLLEQIAKTESQIRFGTFEQHLREYEKQPWKQLANPQVAKARARSLFAAATDDFERLLVEARTERFELAQKKWPELPRACVEGIDLVNGPLESAYTRAAQTALTNRLDLMNQRAGVVDTWRQIAVDANALLGVFNVSYSVNNPPPAAALPALPFSTSRTIQQLTFNGELPLNRRAERNTYRTALINYQRGRRALQAQEDTVLDRVREDLRQLRVLAETYKIQQDQVVLAYNLVENALETFVAPDQPQPATGPPGSSTSGAGNAAALTNQLIQAQSSLNAAQRQLFSIWISYYSLRIQLFFDLEILPLDARGVWIDDHATSDCNPSCLPTIVQPAGDALPAPKPAEPDSVQWRASTVTPVSPKR